ncbi:MFS transporter [Phytomonospora sp. NPDC050363]|uniref:MFS transporter n=1 Tax=Phytomonospora sp. NPDC050363 TaxID=3155642 RepID=UPI0034048A21
MGMWRVGKHKLAAAVLAVGVAALAVMFVPGIAGAEEEDPKDPSGKCALSVWQEDPVGCANALPPVPKDACKETPAPSAPDSGLAGWFSSDPKLPTETEAGFYSTYGYAGYQARLYDVGCLGGTPVDSYTGANSIAGGEFMIATGITGASNALREWAWQPADAWSWSDNLVKTATQAVYEKVFSVFGIITVGVVGLYLIWRSRQAEMSSAMTTVGWAVFMLVLVTAVAKWPTESAQVADGAMTTALTTVNNAVGPPSACDDATEPCVDERPAAVRASDTVTENLLYNNWLRATLGSADSEAAKFYGEALYETTAFSWQEIEEVRADPSRRTTLAEEKAARWRAIAGEIQRSYPEEYEHLQGVRGWERVGAGFLAILSALLFALFDITASILIILGFLLIRWAIIALPIIGTIAILRPAGGGFKRLINIVLSAVINVIVFGVAAAVYLFAVDQILSSALAPWLQILLIALTGAAAWMLLRPYRRMLSLGGGGSMSDSFWGSSKKKEEHVKIIERGGSRGAITAREERPETRAEESRADAVEESGSSSSDRPEVRRDPTPTPRAGGGPGVAVYRPSGARTSSTVTNYEPADRPHTYSGSRPD